VLPGAGRERGALILLRGDECLHCKPLSDSCPAVLAPDNVLQLMNVLKTEGDTLYFRDRLNVISGDLTGCIPHHHLVFSFGRVRLQTPGTGQLAETNIAANLTFQGSKIIKGQIRISSPPTTES
jgi:hypothetical protein